MELKIGDKVMYRKDDKLYEGIIKSIQKDKIEIDDNTAEMIIMAISKNTIADSLILNKEFREKIRRDSMIVNYCRSCANKDKIEYEKLSHERTICSNCRWTDTAFPTRYAEILTEKSKKLITQLIKS